MQCIHEVTDLMNEHLPRLKIKFPQDRRSINVNKQNFMDKFNFPGVLGCIDCTHVAILKPDQDEHNFLNRKGYHSLNVQIICDATMKILNINANFPGASHDSFIWRQSQVRNFLLEKYNNGEMRGTWLLGDSGYPLEPFLMVPFHENAQQPQNDGRENFNRSLRQARCIIERCIGLLKMRFRSIMQERRARYDPHFMGKIVNCCACLHNICVERNIPFNEPQPFPPAPDENIPQNVNIDNNHNMFLAGQQIRQNIVNNYFM
ncbi:hypothetical protein NQ314_010754 [Rhamnusium bicolor]|uniref:Putative nuclease HARBI1 n=1 Tax=Rhamnusium bicolor TaxID=1586634 RepID=A0AAV8XPM2_9CUCU|nr:hypothetical protein NQ314_010754 [Rhamnusium bicolor]